MLTRTQEQEQSLQFDHFTHAHALALVNAIVRLTQEKSDKPVTVHIQHQGLVVAHYLMDGRTDSDWVARKVKTVLTSQHSSLYVWEMAEQKQAYQDWGDDQTYAVCGGGFPIMENGLVTGAIVVSGLNHLDDHALIVTALEEILAN